MDITIRITLVVVAVGAAAILAAQIPLTFEAASIKPAKPPNGVTVSGGRMMSSKGANVAALRNTGGPGTPDPGRIHYPLITLTDLLKRAWDSYFEITSPGWLDSETYAVDATMPPDTTQAQFREMLRNLITVRFKLQYHVESKEISGYSLIAGNRGPKMKQSPDQNGSDLQPPGRPTTRDADGFPVFPPQAGPMFVSLHIPGDRHRIICRQQTIHDLAKYLEIPSVTTVTDATGLTAKYDFTLTYQGGRPGSTPDSEPEPLPEGATPLPDIFSALQSQLGLKLETKKMTAKVMVIDHIEKTPSRN
jgi:uncharacterized protein (TIGR03435 family)